MSAHVGKWIPVRTVRASESALDCMKDAMRIFRILVPPKGMTPDHEWNEDLCEIHAPGVRGSHEMGVDGWLCFQPVGKLPDRSTGVRCDTLRSHL